MELKESYYKRLPVSVSSVVKVFRRNNAMVVVRLPYALLGTKI